MHGFRDNKVFVPTGFEIIVILRQGAQHALVHDELGSSDHDFMILIHSKVLSAMQVSEIMRFIVSRI